MIQPIADAREEDTIRISETTTIPVERELSVIYIREWHGSIRRPGAYGYTPS